MYIYPNTDLYILHNINLNADYDHTAYFDTPSLQFSYFSQVSKVKYHLTNQYYQRKERGWLQVNINQNELWDCTYLMYRNTAYGTKWFYAFILSVDYVNDSVSRINFEIDVMQTWHFEAQLQPCFVEREHTTSDNLFENIIEEDLDLGSDFSVQLFRRLDLTPDRVAVVYTTLLDDTVSPPQPIGGATARKIGNYFTGVGIMQFDMSTQSGWNDLGDFLHLYIDNGYENAILSIYQYPHFIDTLILDPYNTESWDISSAINFVNIDGYVPKNKKLFNYPYNFLKISNNKGEDVIFKNEYWNSPNAIGKFELMGVALGSPAVMCYPLNYRDIAKDYENGLMINGFPECAWTGDAWQVWLAQNRKNLTTAAALGAGALLVGGATMALGASTGQVFSAPTPVEIGAGGSLFPAGFDYSYTNPNNMKSGSFGAIRTGGTIMKAGASSIAGAIASYVHAKNKLEATPRPAYGHYMNDVFNMQTGLCGYTCYQMTIKHEYAQIIDEYFSKFGYACHRIKVPNRVARQKWTFTKTVGCEINGNLPSDDLVKLKSIYDNGITFWRNADNIGNYGDFTNNVLT